MMQSGGGIRVGKTTAAPGEQVEVSVENGATSIEITVVGGPNTTEKKDVPEGGKVTITIPPSAGGGTFVTITAGNPPDSKTIEVVTTGEWR